MRREQMQMDEMDGFNPFFPFYLYDCYENETIDSDYCFKEDDNSIIYFPKAYENFDYQIVGKIFEKEKQLLIEVRGYEDGSYQRYYFRK